MSERDLLRGMMKMIASESLRLIEAAKAEIMTLADRLVLLPLVSGRPVVRRSDELTNGQVEPAAAVGCDGWMEVVANDAVVLLLLLRATWQGDRLNPSCAPED